MMQYTAVLTVRSIPPTKHKSCRCARRTGCGCVLRAGGAVCPVLDGKRTWAMPPRCGAAPSLNRNDGPQRRITCRRDAIGAAVWLFFDPALRDHARNSLFAGRVQAFGG
jgi:hypothetical protein